MSPNERFPLELLPSRVVASILSEFHGRCPTNLEVAERSDDDWLHVPGIGRTALNQIRNLILHQEWPDGPPSWPRLSDAELLAKLEFVQEELQLIGKAVETRLAADHE